VSCRRVNLIASSDPIFVLLIIQVILTGGAIHSPHLLMLSGIGPAEELKDVGVKPVLDRPGVGSNLQDHPAVCK
jgi:choline dehydrogenase